MNTTPFALYQTSLGWLRLEYRDACLTALRPWFADVDDVGQKNTWTDDVCTQINEYAAAKRRHFDFNYHPERGTPFQHAVWNALRDIPYGEVRTYGEIATAIGRPTAARAVGMANAKNPLLIVVPCHRVIGASGALVGYAGGLDLKSRLIQIERL